MISHWFLQFFKPAVDTEGLLSGHSKDTAFFLLVILGISLGLLVLGVLVELPLMKSKRFLRKTSFREYFFPSQKLYQFEERRILKLFFFGGGGGGVGDWVELGWGCVKTHLS